MATVTHTLYSRYDPADRERLQAETGQLDEEDAASEWRKEAALTYPKQTPAAPRFVAAKSTYDSWGEPNDQASGSNVRLDGAMLKQPESMFASLPRTKSDARATNRRPAPQPLSTPQTPPAPSQYVERTNKNNWFIMKAIQSDSGSKSTPATPAPTLADILTRDPPPLPTEQRYQAPIWTVLGPANKGFSMLQRSGWNEGERLGPYAARRNTNPPPTLPHGFFSDSGNGRPREQGNRDTKLKRTIEVNHGDDISELKQVEVVDLTLTSDSESEADIESEAPPASQVPQADSASSSPSDMSGHGGQALLTPIATVLKADRMGIGLKPKTVAGPAGAYRIPKKRVTHNAGAMAAHIRAGEELRKQKKDAGRGRRAFERQRKQEASDRKAMLAYLNS